MKRVRKHYEVTEDTDKKIKQLLELKKQESELSGITLFFSEKMIVEEAINYYHSAKFGKDVFDQTMSKLELVLGNMMTKVINEYAERFAISHGNLFGQNQEIKEMLLLILKANDVLPDDHEKIFSLIMQNNILGEMIHEAVTLKSEGE